MGLTITDTQITADLTDATAHAEAGAWIVSTRPGCLFDRNQAISAMTIEEEKARPHPNQVLIKALESELR